MTYEQGPDWVVLGTPTADGKVAVYASRDLTDAELSREAEYPQWESLFTRVRPQLRHITLTVGMRTFVVVFGHTYQEAFGYLFEHWSPDGGRADVVREAIAAPRRAIEGGAR